MNKNRSTMPAQKFKEWNIKSLRNFLNCQLENFPNQPLEIKQYSTGVSNLTYYIQSGEWKGVIRRPPSGPLPPKAHDMRRESEFLKKLYSAYPLVPMPYIYSDDITIIGAPFYVMEYKEGVVLDDKFPQGFNPSPKLCLDISVQVAEALGELHSINYKELFLDKMGYPEGFLNRQVNGWIMRYKKYKTDDIPFADEISTWLINHIPLSKYTAIIHNDYKLNNMLFSEDFKKLIAVLDWEIATVADPIFDLAGALGYWMEENDPDYLRESLPTVTPNPGFFKRRDFIERYSLKSGIEIPPLDFYMVFTYFKLAVVLQQIYYRWKLGQNNDERVVGFKEKIRNLMYHSYTIVIEKSKF